MLEGLIHRGILVAVATLIFVVLGVVLTLNIPVQMIPDLEVRTISIRTQWPGATPQDIEKEILIEQEEHLRSVPGLQRLKSSASFGSAQIELDFPFGIDLGKTLIEVMNALSRVPSYPLNVDEPRIYSSSFSSNSFMFFRVTPKPIEHQEQKQEQNQEQKPEQSQVIDLIPMQDFIKDYVAVQMETVPGVSEVNVYGGAERQIQILIDPQRLAELNLTITQVRDAIRQRNQDFSAGEIDSGKRRYLLRTIGRFEDLEELKQLMVAQHQDAVIRLKEVAKVHFGHREISRYSFANGEAAIGLSVRKQSGSNVINIKRQMMEKVARINTEILHPKGMQMRLVADDVGYVQASISNVWFNLSLGALLATLVMYLFLRSGRATLVAIIGIPICTIAAFVGLSLAGRTINVISLAGVAFAIGMTLDNSIVVLESIEQSWRKGLDRWQAAMQGMKSVWPAVLASTLTTVMVFIPVLFVKEEAGQLYSDIAIAISTSILASMLFAIAVLPVATAHLVMKKRKKNSNNTAEQNHGVTMGVWVKTIVGLIKTPFRRIGVIAIVIGVCTAIIVYLTPPAEYLPEGEEPKIFAMLIPPTGYNLETMKKIGEDLQNELLPYLEHSPQQFEKGETQVPALAYLNLSVQASRIRIISQPKNPHHIKGLIKAIGEKFKGYVGMRSFISRGSIISSNNGGTRSVNLDISGPSLQSIYQVALLAEQQAKQVFKSPRIRSEPSSLTLSQPLVEIRPKWERINEMGLSHADMGITISSLMDGAFADEFFMDDDKVDIYLYSQQGHSSNLDNLDKISLYTPQQKVIALSALVEINETVDTSTIRRVDGKRTVTLNIIPPEQIALETAVEMVRNQVVATLRENGAIPNSVSINISGASDQLQATQQSLGVNYLIALIIIYLILVAIFSHWLYPILIMTTIPLGIASGIVGLELLNMVGGWLPSIGLLAIHQSFDMITMLGFLILMGTVVNNPILIVDQATKNLRQGENVLDAIAHAVNSRLRPIAMSTLTTVFGLAPLVFIPGEGTELYRGVGVIVLAGILGTALVTLTYLPAMTYIVLSWFGGEGDGTKSDKHQSEAAALSAGSS